MRAATELLNSLSPSCMIPFSGFWNGQRRSHYPFDHFIIGHAESNQLIADITLRPVNALAAVPLSVIHARQHIQGVAIQLVAVTLIAIAFTVPVDAVSWPANPQACELSRLAANHKSLARKTKVEACVRLRAYLHDPRRLHSPDRASDG